MGIKKIWNLKNKNLPPRSKFNQLNSYFAKWSREHGDGRHFAQSRWKRRRSRPPLALAPVRIQPHTHTVSNFFFFFFSNKYVCIYSCSYEFVCKCRSAKKALDEWYSGKDSGATDLYKLLSNCINTFKHHSQYKNDIRFLKIWFLYVINLLYHFPKFDRIVSMV